MKRRAFFFAALSGMFFCMSAVLDADLPRTAEWGQWRGPLFNGVAATDAVPPAEWDETTVAWRKALPGLGHSTPVVAGDYLYLTTAIPTDEYLDAEAFALQLEDMQDWHSGRIRTSSNVHEFAVMAINRHDGSKAWQTVVNRRAPLFRTHSGGSWASGSPLTDGERLYAWFGTYGLYCLNMSGEVQWAKDIGVFPMHNHFGEGGTPALHGNRLVLNCDYQGESFITVLDAVSGAELWRRERDEISSWSTPLVVEHPGRPAQVIVSATRRITSYRLDDGEILWECGGMTRNVIPVPVYDGRNVIVTSGFRGNALLVIDLDKAAGDFTESGAAVAWSHNRNTPYVPSPVVHDGLLYFLEHNRPKLSCFDVADGTAAYEAVEIAGLAGIYASPVLAGGRLYIPDLEGNTAVVRAGREFHLKAVNRLPDEFTASPVVIGGDLYLRGHRKLWCIRAE